MNAVIIEYPDSLPEVFDDQVFYLYIKKTDGVDPGLYQVCGAQCRERKHKLYPDMLIDTGLPEVFLTYGDGEISVDCMDKGSCKIVVDEAATALVMLGFAKANINKVLPEIIKKSPDIKVEALIKEALKRL